MTSVPGVAQRTGATNYYVELFPKIGDHRRTPAPPVLGLTPVPGDVDIVIASELMEAGRAVQRGLVTPDKHHVHRLDQPRLCDDREDRDGRRPRRFAGFAGRRAAPRRSGSFTATWRSLRKSTGSVISSVLFGALAGANVLPMQRMAFEAAIRRGGVGVKESLAAFGAGFAAATDGVTLKASEPVVSHVSPALAPLMAEASAYPEPARTYVRAGIERTADYQDVAYAREYLDRLKPIAEAERRHGNGSGLMFAETARELALGMAYEDTVRVAELKIRPGRFERVREEAQLADGQILEIAEFLHPRVQEIADTLPAGLGRWLLGSGWPRRLLERFTRKGKVLKTSSILGFLQLYFVASLKPTRRRSLRFQNEHAFLDAWLRKILDVAQTNYALATEIALTRTLVKGYSDTHERGRERYDTLMQLLPRIMEAPDAAATLGKLRKAALADDTGAALNAAIKDIRPLQQAAE